MSPGIGKCPLGAESPQLRTSKIEYVCGAPNFLTLGTHGGGLPPNKLCLSVAQAAPQT